MFWTKSPGTGGHIEQEDDFVVEEIPSPKFFVKFKRGPSGVSAVEGPNSLALLTKKGMTTKDAVEFIRNELKCEVGYAGLKDKFAVTSQYVTIRGHARDLDMKNMQLKIVGSTDRMMQVGELEGNRFRITLRNCKKPENAAAFAKELTKRGMPNYFGPQRFGLQGNNHVIGKLILRLELGKALDLINRQSKRQFDSLRDVEKKRLKFYMHAYQSFLFNKLLDKYISAKKLPFYGNFPIVGYGTKIKPDFIGKELNRLMKKDKISIGDFSIRELSITCTGSKRPAFVKSENLEYRVDNKNLTVSFALPKGSYATVLIREMSKNSLMPKNSVAF